MPANDLYICDTCNGTWTIKRESMMHTHAPSFCPSCGAQDLRMIKSAVRENMSARSLRGVDPRLVMMVYSQWMQERNGNLHPTHAMFVEYLFALIKESA